MNDISWGDMAQGAVAGSSLGPWGAAGGAVVGLLQAKERAKQQRQDAMMQAMGQELAPIFGNAPVQYEMPQENQWSKVAEAGGTYIAQKQANEKAAAEEQARKEQLEEQRAMRMAILESIREQKNPRF